MRLFSLPPPAVAPPFAQVRYAVTSENPTIRALNTAAGNPWPRDEIDAALANDRYQPLIATRGALAAGFALYRLTPSAVELALVVANPGWTRRGVGRQLVERVREVVTSARKARLEAVVPEEFLAAQLLMRRCGLRSHRVGGSYVVLDHFGWKRRGYAFRWSPEDLALGTQNSPEKIP
jgi:GNAT superfamily N-acetyltransferase